jgi:hypothetical protein
MFSIREEDEFSPDVAHYNYCYLLHLDCLATPAADLWTTYGRPMPTYDRAFPARPQGLIFP